MSKARKGFAAQDDDVCDGTRGALCSHQDPNSCDRSRDCPAFVALPAPAEPAQSESYMPGCPILIEATPDYYTEAQMRAYGEACFRAGAACWQGKR